MQYDSQTSMKILLAAATAIFGSIGLFVRSIPLTSAQLSMLRGFAGGIALAAASCAAGHSFTWQNIRSNTKYLLIAGTGIGINWILFFEAVRWTSIAVGTICYYFAPVFVLILAPIVLHEKTKKTTVVCIIVSLIGLCCIAGGSGGSGPNDLLGIACGLGAAVMYSIDIMANKCLRGITPTESTVTELIVASAVLLPYVMANGGLSFAALDTTGWFCLAMLCFFHTSLAYLMYFKAMRSLPAQTTAILSYADPLSAIVLSWLVLGEKMTPLQMLGGALILGATLVNELKSR